jgi:hypothetical protein
MFGIWWIEGIWMRLWENGFPTTLTTRKLDIIGGKF